MTKLEEVEQAVAALPAEELDAFRAWFEEFEARRFDDKIEQDAASGRLDALAAAARQEFASGRTREL